VIGRLEAIDRAEAAAGAGLAVVIAGLAVLADGLVAAAPSSQLSSADRLTYGLWSVRLEHGLVFTVGLVVALWGFSAGARLGGWRDPALRLTTGLAFGVAALAVAVLLAATDIALRGHVGSGFAEISLNGRERTFIWLRQAVTAAGFGGSWAVAGAQLAKLARPDDDAVPAAEQPEEPAATAVAARLPVPEPALGPVSGPAPPPAAHVSPDRYKPVTRPVTAPGADQVGGTLSGRARHTYRERLAYSPSGPRARELADRIEQLEQQGQTAEAERLLAELEAL
jgi:hypothetical protein